MKKIIAQMFCLGLLLISNSVFAQRSPTAPNYSMPSIELGFKSNTASITGSSSNKQENGFQLGFSGVFNLSDALGMKSGLFYSERPFSAEFVGSTTSSGKVTYFDVPLLLMFKFEEYAGIYAGPSLSLKLGDELSPGTLAGVKSMIVPFTLGVQFKFMPNLGMNAFFETAAGEIATGIENTRAVGVNLLFTID